MLKNINCAKLIYPAGIIAILFCLLSCEFNQDQEKEKLKEGLEIKHTRLYGDEKGFAHYAFYVKNNNEKPIKFAKLSLFILGTRTGMFPNEVRFENLSAGDSICLSVNLLNDYSYKQDYHFSSKVEEITF